MDFTKKYDVAVVGGGIIHCTTAQINQAAKPVRMAGQIFKHRRNNFC